MRKCIYHLIIAVSFSACDRMHSFDIGNTQLYNIRDAKMIQVSSHDTTGGNNDRINIHDGDTAAIFDVSGPGLITRMWFTIDSRDPDYLRNIILTVYWDDEENPSVWSPIGDFFGSPFEYRHFQSENIGMTSGGYYCYFPMPFSKSARIEIINQTGQEVYAFYYHINYYELENGFSSETGYFHAFWTRNVRTIQADNHIVLEAVGKGQFVGMHYSGQSYDRRLVYLEGDEMIYVDGENYPSTYGTGMEDYFNSGWYFKTGEFSAPYHGLVLLDQETGRVSAYRHHIRDAIPFNNQIKVTLEHGHANEESVDISTTAFWYQTEPHTPFGAEGKSGLRKVLKRPVPNDVFEGEELVDGNVPSLSVVDMSDFSSDWSNNKELQWKDGSNTDITLNINNLNEQAYNLEFYFTKGPEYTDFVLTAGKESVKFQDFSEMVAPADGISIDGVPVENGTIAFTLTNRNSGSSIVGLDAIELTPVRKYIPEWYMIGPFDNPRRSDDERFGIDMVFPPEEEVNLNATYVGKGEQKVRWQKVDGTPGGYGMRLWDLFDPYEFVISYAYTNVYSPDNREVILMFSSDDGSKIFLNDVEIYRYLTVNIARPDQFEVVLPLKKGWNKLLLKLENNFGGYAFYARIPDPDLVYSADRILP